MSAPALGLAQQVDDRLQMTVERAQLGASWTPEFDHIGKHSAVLLLDDGTKMKKLKFKISVVNPLPVGLG